MLKLTALAGAFLLTAGAAVAAPQDVTIVNATGKGMLRFYASATTTQDWGSDILGAGVVPQGGQVTVRINDPANACRFDFKVVLEDGQSVVRHNVNICQTRQYRFEA